MEGMEGGRDRVVWWWMGWRLDVPWRAKGADSDDEDLEERRAEEPGRTKGADCVLDPWGFGSMAGVIAHDFC